MPKRRPRKRPRKTEPEVDVPEVGPSESDDPDVEIKVRTVRVSMERVYRVGEFRTLRYGLGVELEVPDGALADDVVERGTLFLDRKVEEFATDRALDHVRTVDPNFDDRPGRAPFEDDEEEENDDEVDDDLDVEDLEDEEDEDEEDEDEDEDE